MNSSRPLPDGFAHFSLVGRTALVTGAGRGIGASCALALSRAGAEVWLAARNGAITGSSILVDGGWTAQ
jgi:hypothetical protein